MTAMSTAATTGPAVRTITLAELMGVAELQTRVDRKYLLPVDTLDLLEHADPDLAVLEIAGTTAHRYASQYLDTPALASYHLAAHARPRRFKVRTRTYCDSGERFLEVKTRGRRGETVKDRQPHLDTSAAELADFAIGTIRERTGWDVSTQPLLPVLTVQYTRTTYLLPASNSRVTVDTDLTWALPGATTGMHLPGWAVVETKTAGRPCALDTLLWRHGCRPVRLSKFACGLALLREDTLPTNRWHRTLTRLTTATTATTAITARPTHWETP